MTPSIIRRFARYHGIKLIKPGDPMYCHEPAQLAEAIYGRLEWGESARARDKIIQSLTRIEDAEMLDATIAAEYQDTWYQRRERAALSRAYVALLKLAGVDPAKWREVKDE
jgi:hypothetical protein